MDFTSQQVQFSQQFGRPAAWSALAQQQTLQQPSPWRNHLIHQRPAFFGQPQYVNPQQFSLGQPLVFQRPQYRCPQPAFRQSVVTPQPQFVDPRQTLLRPEAPRQPVIVHPEEVVDLTKGDDEEDEDEVEFMREQEKVPDSTAEPALKQAPTPVGSAWRDLMSLKAQQTRFSSQKQSEGIKIARENAATLGLSPAEYLKTLEERFEPPKHTAKAAATLDDAAAPSSKGVCVHTSQSNPSRKRKVSASSTASSNSAPKEPAAKPTKRRKVVIAPELNAPVEAESQIIGTAAVREHSDNLPNGERDCPYEVDVVNTPSSTSAQETVPQVAEPPVSDEDNDSLFDDEPEPLPDIDAETSSTLTPVSAPTPAPTPAPIPTQEAANITTPDSGYESDEMMAELEKALAERDGEVEEEKKQEEEEEEEVSKEE